MNTTATPERVKSTSGKASSAKKKSAKKKRNPRPPIITEMGVQRMTASHPTIKQLKKEYPTSIHGDKFWTSSYLLMDYLNDNPPKKNMRILDIGCGWGLASIFCKQKFGCKVTACDADEEVFPYVKAHAELNEVKIKTLKCKFEKLSKKKLRKYDLIIGADICFWDELADTLYDLLKRARKAGVSKFVLADPQRQPFIDLCDRLDGKFTHEVWDWELPDPTPADGDILVVNLDES